ncbi:MAG: ATP-binding protein, partial [Nitrososphaerota archaeon]
AQIEESNNFICIIPDEKTNEMYKKFVIQKPECKLSVCPLYGKRTIVFIAGPSGCGKTTFALKFMKQYLSMHPEHKAIIFTADAKDETIQKYKTPEMKIFNLADPKLSKMQNIDPAMFRDSIVFFDDIDFLMNQSLIHKLNDLRDRMVGIGRHFNISVLISKHMVMDYRATRNILSEACYIVVFPKSGSTRFVDSFFKTYFSSANQEVKNEISQSHSRWVCCRMVHPQLVITEKEIFLL